MDKEKLAGERDVAREKLFRQLHLHDDGGDFTYVFNSAWNAALRSSPDATSDRLARRMGAEFVNSTPPPAATVEAVARAICLELGGPRIWQQCVPAATAAIAAMQPLLADREGLVEAARAYAAENDEDQWCQRLKYGQCALRRCNVEGGWTPGTPCDHSLATCARYRLEQALTALTQKGPPDG